MTKFKNVFLLAAMAVSAVFVACDKEDDNFTFKDTTLKLTANDGGTTIITFISATEFRASGSETKTGTYTFVEQTLTLTFSDGTIPPIILTKDGDTFTSADYIVTTGDSDGNTSAFDGKIQATVEKAPSNSTVNAVKVVEYGDGGAHVLAEGEYKDGSFTLTLPTTGLDAYLTSVKDGFNAPDDITVSDATAKALVFTIIWAYKGATEVSYFYYANAYEYEFDDFSIITAFTYVDKDVSMTGSYSYTDTDREGDWIITRTYNASLKKGWNKMYVKSTPSKTEKTKTEEITTTEPSGLKWYFVEHDHPIVEDIDDDTLAAALLANKTYGSFNDDLQLLLTFITATDYKIESWNGDSEESESSVGTWSVNNGRLQLIDSNGYRLVGEITNPETFTLLVEGQVSFTFTKR